MQLYMYEADGDESDEEDEMAGDSISVDDSMLAGGSDKENIN